MLEAIARLAAGRTTVVITHSLADAMDADEVIVLERGQIVEQGRPQDLIREDASRLTLLRQRGDEPVAASKERHVSAQAS